MLLIPPVSLPHATYQLRELTIGEAIGLVKMNPTAHEHTISQFLACVLTGNGRALTVQERYLLVAQYISATCVGEADFPIGDTAQYSDYLRMNKPLSLDFVALGFEETWCVHPLYGWQAEALEDNIAYTAKRLLDGSYTLYNAIGKLVYTLKQKECGTKILQHIKDITPKIKRSVFMENDEFAYLCAEAGLKAPDLRKIFGVRKSEVLLWLNDDENDDYYEIPEHVILRVRKQLDYANTLVEQNVNFVLSQKPALGAVILLLSYQTQKELYQKSPSLISLNYHGQILRRTQTKLEQLGYRIETSYITSSLLKREGYYKKSLKDAILVIPIGHKED